MKKILLLYIATQKTFIKLKDLVKSYKIGVIR